MNTNDRMSGRWIGLLVSAALVLGACSSASTEASSVDDPESPASLPLDDGTSTSETDTETTAADQTFDLDEFTSLSDLENIEITPELFEMLKTNETSRAAVLEEMEAQGLGSEEAVCFLDQVSPGLFIAFGSGQQPDDAQFGELLGLVETCEIAFGA